MFRVHHANFGPLPTLEEETASCIEDCEVNDTLFQTDTKPDIMNHEISKSNENLDQYKIEQKEIQQKKLVEQRDMMKQNPSLRSSLTSIDHSTIDSSTSESLTGKISLFSLNNSRSNTISDRLVNQRSQSPILMVGGDDRRASAQPTGLHQEDRVPYQQLTHNIRMMQSYWDAQRQISSGMPAPNPYHVQYCPVIMNSLRDSEIQSMSSNSTSDYSLIVFNKEQQRHAKQSFNNHNANNSNIGNKNNNQTTNSGQHQMNKTVNSRHAALLHQQLDQQQQHLKRSMPNPTHNQEEFAKQLITKLNEVIESTRKSQQFFQQMREIDSDSSSSANQVVNNATTNTLTEAGSRLKQALKSKQFDFGPPERETDCQSILDKHCAIVFDETPINSGTPNNIQGCSSQQQQSGGSLLDGSSSHHGVGSNNVPVASHIPRYYSGGYSQNKMQQTNQHTYTTSFNNNNYPPINNRLIHSPQHHHHPHHHQQVQVTLRFSDEDYPYKLTMVGPVVTLRQFKQSIPTKKGGFRFYFKRKCTEHEQRENNTFFMQELIEDDGAELPQCDGKIFATAHHHN